MAKQSLSTQISTALKSYKNGASKLSNVIGLSIQFAQENSHNPVHIQKIMDGVDPQDAALVATIVKAAGPFNVTEGQVTVKKGKDRQYDAGILSMLVKDKATSFRTIAASLTGNKPEPKPFDAEAYAAKVLARVLKEGVALEQFSQALAMAAKKVDEKAKA